MSLLYLNKILVKALDWFIGLITVAVVLILFVGVILRYVFSSPLFWAEEVTVLGLIWMTFIGGAILVRQDKNVTITAVYDLLPPRARRFMRLLSDSLVLLMVGVMVYLSWALTKRLAFSTTPAIRLSESWFGYAMIFGFALMFYYQAQRVIALFRGREPFAEEAEGPGRGES